MYIAPFIAVGRSVFTSFLKSEFSQENINFWVACEEYKKTPPSQMQTRAKQIFQQYIEADAPNEVKHTNTSLSLFSGHWTDVAIGSKVKKAKQNIKC